MLEDEFIDEKHIVHKKPEKRFPVKPKPPPTGRARPQNPRKLADDEYIDEESGVVVEPEENFRVVSVG